MTGSGGGTGGGAYRPGSGVSVPRVLQEVKPQYTADAMRAKVQGTVWLECIVMPDGTVGDVRVTESLDSVFGLDQEAIKAARQWKFVPGMRKGEPVPVHHHHRADLHAALDGLRTGFHRRVSKSRRCNILGHDSVLAGLASS